MQAADTAWHSVHSEDLKVGLSFRRPKFLHIFLPCLSLAQDLCVKYNFALPIRVALQITSMNLNKVLQALTMVPCLALCRLVQYVPER